MLGYNVRSPSTTTTPAVTPAVEPTPAELQPEGNSEVARTLDAGDTGVGGGLLEALTAETAGCGYEVQPGDTLWDIAESRLGDPLGWTQLYGDNQGVVGANPDLILPGQVLDLCHDTLLTGEATNEAGQALTEVAEETTPPTFVDVAEGMFPTLAGEDGYLSEADLDAAMTNPDLTLEQSAALVTLRQLRADLEELSDDEYFDENDGVSMADLEEYRRTGVLPGQVSTPDDWFGHHRLQMEGQSTELFANGLPDGNALQQGGIGDCYFLAALGSAVAQNPQAVADMVVAEEDGTYTVTFPDGRSANVAAPTRAEMATYGSSGADGMWVTLFERAAGHIADEDAVIPEEALDGGALLGRWGTNLFSADGETNTDNFSFTGDDTTRDRLESAFTEGRVVTVGTRGGPDEGPEGLPRGHVYSVLGYDRETDTVTVRNPWGRGERKNGEGAVADGTDDGTMTMTVEEFSRLYSYVSYSSSAFAPAE